MTKWWGTQLNTSDGIISCPMCRAEPSKDDIEYTTIRAWALCYTQKKSKGEEYFKRWSEEVKISWQQSRSTPMDQLLDASDFFPSA